MSGNPIELRNGVSVVVGQPMDVVIDGTIVDQSPFYLFDAARGIEEHISVEFASWLLGRNNAWHGITDEHEAHFKEHLTERGWTKGAPIKSQPKKLVQKALSYSKEIVRPNEALKATMPYWSWLFGSVGYLLFSILFLFVLILLAGSYSEIIGYYGEYKGAAITIPVALVVVKALHELGHAMAFVKAGARVTGINIVLIAWIMPLPKTDAIEIYRTTYSQRIKIGAAGMYMEAWAALIAALLWVSVDDGPARVAFHFIAMVSLPLTIAINILPLMKFDGYFIISNLVKNPRLFEDAVAAFRNTVYNVLGVDTVAPQSFRKHPRWILVGYGAAIFVWKILLPVGIIIALTAIIDARAAYFLMIAPVIGMWIGPGIKEISDFREAYMETKMSLNKRAAQFLCLMLLTMIGYWWVAPVPHFTTVDGAVVRDHVVIKSPIDGITTSLGREGPASKGSSLVQIRPYEVDATNAQAEIYAKTALSSSLAKDEFEYNTRYYSERSKNTENIIASQVDNGLVKAMESGYWIPAELKPIIRVGDPVGELVFSSGKLLAFIPHSHEKPATIEAVVQFQNGTTKKITLDRASVITNTNALPQWVSVPTSQPYQLYVYEFEAAPASQNVAVHYKYEYSLFKRWSRKVKAYL